MDLLLIFYLPWSTIAQLQCVQNAATPLILGLSAQDHVHDAVLQLHWLPDHYRIQFKVALKCTWFSQTRLLATLWTVCHLVTDFNQSQAQEQSLATVERFFQIL